MGTEIHHLSNMGGLSETSFGTRTGLVTVQLNPMLPGPPN